MVELIKIIFLFTIIYQKYSNRLGKMKFYQHHVQRNLRKRQENKFAFVDFERSDYNNNIGTYGFYHDIFVIFV